MNSAPFVLTVSEGYRVLPSASRWNSIEIDFNLLPQNSLTSSISSKYSKSFDYNLIISNRKVFKRFLYGSVSLILLVIGLILLLHFLSHEHSANVSASNFAIPVNRALLFFDAQKSGHLPNNDAVKFRGDSGLHDGNTTQTNVNLVGGFYDSGNNIKFTFPTAYTITLLSWTVIEYHQKYEDMRELDHIKNIIKWGSDYLFKTFVVSNSTSQPTILYSQVGSPTDINCWQRPEDMSYPRPVSVCQNTGGDLAGEIVAALSASSLVFKDEIAYSAKLANAAEDLFVQATNFPVKQGVYTSNYECGGEARQFYNSSGFTDEMAWAGTWLYFATGNTSHLQYATTNFQKAMIEKELSVNRGVFDWNSKLAANAVLLTRLRFFNDPGYPHEPTLATAQEMSDGLMCSYLYQHYNTTSGGLILLKPEQSAPLQYAATASFLSKLYSDYLYATKNPGVNCMAHSVAVDALQSFSMSQVDYILGNNPMKMSYLVGFKDKFPNHVHHRSASIPWDHQHHSCEEGKKWLNSKDPNPNVLIGGMVAGPDQDDKFIDSRTKPEYTEPTLSGNAGLVAALIALHQPPHNSSVKDMSQGMDIRGIFIHLLT